MIANRLIEAGMKQAQGVQASVVESEATTVSFENDRLKSVKSRQGTGMSAKIIAEGKIGSSLTSDIDDIDGVVARALEAAAFGSPVHFDLPGPQQGGDVAVYDDAVPPVTKEEMVHIGEEMIAIVKAYNPDIVVSAGAGKDLSKRRFANSAGMEFTTETTNFGLWVSGQWIRGTDILWAGHGFEWKKREIDHRDIANRAVEWFRMAETTAPVRSGDMPVIFTPEGMSVLLLALSMGFNGKNVFLGSSPLAGKRGKRIADERFSLTDNPLIDYAEGSGTYDGEGVPHQINPLIENGVVTNFLYDLDTAGRAGTKTTGNGIGCNPTNIVIKEGETPYTEMVKNTKKGLLVHSVLGLGQGNPMSGEFSVNIHLGYKIENGEIVGRVKDVMLAGNTYEALKTITAIGSKAEWSEGSVLTPPVQIGTLSVVAK